MKPLEIFKAGSHTDKNGNKYTVTVADLVKTAKAYAPNVHEAPFVVGHPQENLPAYGWAEKLTVEGDALVAHPKQVNADFSDLVESGAFKKRSSSFYLPNASNNPVPGVLYLRHVGFLGAQAPAIKGLKEVEFSESDGCVEFSENTSYAFQVVHRLFSRLRDIFIEKNGVEEADKYLPTWDLDYLKELSTEESANFSDSVVASIATPLSTPVSESQSVPPINQPEGDDMSKELEVQLASEKAAREKVEKELNDLRTAQAATEKQARETANADFAEGLIKGGKLLPKNAELVKGLLNAAPITADFSEGTSYLDVLKGFLSDGPKVIEFSEQATKGQEKTDGTMDYAEGTDPEAIALDQKVKAYMAQNKVDYQTAFARVLQH